MMLIKVINWTELSKTARLLLYGRNHETEECECGDGTAGPLKQLLCILYYTEKSLYLEL